MSEGHTGPLAAMEDRGHEHVGYHRDEATGLRCLVALHDTRLGPPVGGTRMLEYANESEALEDALRLSEAMAYKTAAADLDLGGGKAVVVGDPETKTDDLLHAYGRVVDSYGGAFITGEDVNVDVGDVRTIGEVYDVDCDVFAPCALGGVLDDGTIPRLRCDAVCGAANNQLAARRHAEGLAERGILYAPDYVVNAGGLISGVVELEGGDTADAMERVRGIRDRLERTFETARSEDIIPLAAADRYAERRMEAGGEALFP